MNYITKDILFQSLFNCVYALFSKYCPSREKLTKPRSAEEDEALENEVYDELYNHFKLCWLAGNMDLMRIRILCSNDSSAEKLIGDKYEDNADEASLAAHLGIHNKLILILDDVFELGFEMENAKNAEELDKLCSEMTNMLQSYSNEVYGYGASKYILFKEDYDFSNTKGTDERYVIFRVPAEEQQNYKFELPQDNVSYQPDYISIKVPEDLNLPVVSYFQ